MAEYTEKRAHPRVELLARVQLSRDDACHVMEVRNISRGGLFVLGDLAACPGLAVGKVVEVQISDLDDVEGESLQQQAVIVRAEEGARQGFGLMFVNVDVEGAARLDRFLAAAGLPAPRRGPPPPPPTRREQRQSPRIELYAQVQVTRESACHVMATGNISRGGVFIQGDPVDHPDLTLGASVELVLFDPEDPDHAGVSLEGVVVHVREGQRQGFGVKFINMNHLNLSLLDAYLRARGYPGGAGA
jgi:hypothetical protein